MKKVLRTLALGVLALTMAAPTLHSQTDKPQNPAAKAAQKVAKKQQKAMKKQQKAQKKLVKEIRKRSQRSW